MSYPIAFINSNERFFKNKNNGKGYLVEFVDNDYFLYEIQITLDLEEVMSSKIRELKVYITNSTSTSHYESSISAMPLAVTNNTPETAVTNIHSSGHADLASTTFINQNSKKFMITSIDPKKFVDLNRYKNNFKGSASDKFGLISQITSYIEKKPNIELNTDSISLMPNSINTTLSSLVNKLSEKTERGLFQGVPITKTVALHKLKMKKAATRHKITEEEAKSKEHIVSTGAPAHVREFEHDENELQELIPDFSKSKTETRQRLLVNKSANTTRAITFLLKIKVSDLIKSEVNYQNFGILLEASDKNNLVLDRQVVSISLESDIDSKKTSLEDFFITSSEERGNFYIHANNPTSSRIVINLFNKCLKKNIPFYSNKFYKLASTRIRPDRPKAVFKMKKSTGRNGDIFNDSENRNAKLVQLDNLDVPNFFRVTPVVNNINFDNMYEIGFNSKKPYDNRFIPMFIANEKVGEKMVASVNIDVANIPRKFKKIKVYKKDLTRAIYGNFKDNLEAAHDNQFSPIGQIRLGTYPSSQGEDSREDRTHDMRKKGLNDFTKIIDYNIEPERLYMYRIELFEDVGRVQKIYSTSYFQEKIEKPENVCSVTFNPEETSRRGNSATISLDITIKETDAEKVFKSLLDDKFDLFEDEIKEIGSITTDAIAIKIERISIDDCTIDTLAYVSRPASTGPTVSSGNINNFTLTYTDSNISRNKDYVYKVTSCLKPVSEIIAGISDEISYRGTSPSLGSGNYSKYRFAKLRKKITKLDTETLYDLASKLSQGRGIKKSVIIDPETASGMSGQNYFSKASTGDMAYYGLFRQAPPSINSALGKNYNSSGCKGFKLNSIQYFSEKTFHQILTKNEIKNKFIIDFNCRFRDDIDYCAIFMRNEGVFEYCCNIHVPSYYDDQKSNYKVLIEKYGLTGNVIFYIFPVTKYGRILNKVQLGSQRV